MTIQFEAIPNVEQIEQKFMQELANGEGGVTRRVALTVLSQPSEYYYNQAMDDETRQAFLSSIDSMTVYIDLMKLHLEMMEAARARVFAVMKYHFG